MDGLTALQVKGLTEYFREYVSEHKQHLFEKILNQRTRHFTIALENIYQTQNASAAIRSAECYGLQDVHIIENEYRFETNKNVVLGAEKWLDIIYHNELAFNTEACFNHLRLNGYKIYTAHPDPSAVSIYDLKIDQPFAAVFGTEKTGLTEQALQQADKAFYIPIYGFTESYNISVSVAISLTILKQRLEQEKIQYFLNEHEKNLIRLKWYKNMVRRADLMEKEFLKNNF